MLAEQDSCMKRGGVHGPYECGEVHVYETDRASRRQSCTLGTPHTDLEL